jgi:hypothetical protein
MWSQYTVRIVAMPSDDNLLCMVHIITTSVFQWKEPWHKWTGRRLSKMVCWSNWLVANKMQMDEMESMRYLPPPIWRPANDLVLRTVWTYLAKHDSRKKSKICCDGLLLWYPGLNYTQKWFTTCISQTSAKILFSYIVIRIWIAIEEAGRDSKHTNNV